MTKDRFEQLFEEGNYEEIIRTLSSVPERSLSYEEAGMLIRTYITNNNYEEARRLLELVKESGKDDSLWYYRYGYLYFKKEEYAEAEKVLRKGLELDEKDGSIYYLLWYVLNSMEKPDEAEKISDCFREIDPEEWDELFGEKLANGDTEGKEVSVTAAIIPPGASTGEYEVEAVLKRLQESDWFELEDLGFDEEREVPTATVSYLGELYKFSFELFEFQMTDMFRISHHLSEKNLELLEQADLAMGVTMYFSPEPLTSYHLQIKILQTLIPELIAVADYSAFNVYSPFWIQLAAESTVPPSPIYLYTVHAIRDDKKGWFTRENKQGVWLHTHGLNRCGFPELEIINSTVGASENHYSLLNQMASRAVIAGEMVEELEPLYAAQTHEQKPLVTTWVHWEKVIDSYKKDILGGRKDRRDEDHSGNTGLVYLYLTEDDYEKKKYTPVTLLPDSDYENLLIMISDEETERMSLLARERFPYLVRGLQEEGSSAIVKMCIPVDEDKKEDAGTDFEHIWFEVEEIEGENITAKLMQEPYFFKHIQVGETVTLPLTSLTDWLMYIGETTVNPDHAYLVAGLKG